VKKLSEKYRRAFEHEQPYNGRNPNLFILHELSRIYRHRVIHPVTGVLASDENRITIQGGSGTIERQQLIHSGPFTSDDKIMTFTLRGLVHGG
jgi:hypothetical protein